MKLKKINWEIMKLKSFCDDTELIGDENSVSVCVYC